MPTQSKTVKCDICQASVKEKGLALHKTRMHATMASEPVKPQRPYYVGSAVAMYRAIERAELRLERKEQQLGSFLLQLTPAEFSEYVAQTLE